MSPVGVALGLGGLTLGFGGVASIRRNTLSGLGSGLVMVGRLKAKLLDPALAEYHLALGVICREWAQLETVINWCLCDLVDGHKIGLEYIFAPLAVRDEMASIKIAATFARKGQRWTNSVVDAVNYIDNTLRPIRNRYVHDNWFRDLDPKRVYRMERSVKLQRSQSHAPLGPVIPDATLVPLKEMWQVASEIREHGIWLRFLCLPDHVLWLSSRPKPPQRRFQEKKQRKAPQPAGTRAKPRPSQKSSAE